MTHKTNGSALLITLLFLGALGFLAQQLIQSALLTSRLLTDQINTTEAQILALNGLTLACAQLNPLKKAPKKQGTTAPEDPKKTFLKWILPILNRWQTFKLTNDADGVDGTLKICICCEEGKIPLLDLVDQKNKTPNKTYAPLLKTFQEVIAKKNTGLPAMLTNFLAKQKEPIADPTQLNLSYRHMLFYDPTKPRLNKKLPPPAPTLPWLDLFSSWNTTNKINPLFLSSSTCTVLRLKNPFNKPIDDKSEKELYPRIAEAVSKEWGSDWKKNWTILAPLYGADPQMSQEVTALLSEAVEPEVYSVLSCGVVRGIEQRLYAIIHKKPTAQATDSNDTTTPNASSKKTLITSTTCLSPESPCGIIRMYWVDQFNTNDNQTVGLNA